ncbi:hypothetical protein D3C87_1926370 [compost metagenome]
MAVEQRLDRRQIALRCCIVSQVNRVDGAYKVGQGVTQLRQDLVSQRRQLAVASQQFVQRHCRRCRTVADDHQPLSAQRMHMAQRFHCREQLVGILYAQ